MADKTNDVILELAQLPENQLKCPKEYDKSDVRCGENNGCIGCPFLISAEEYLNCAVIAWNFGPFNQDEVAKMTKLSQTTICVTEKEALAKMKEGLLKDEEIAFEVKKSKRLAEKRDVKVDEATIYVLEAIVERYERERNGGGC